MPEMPPPPPYSQSFSPAYVPAPQRGMFGTKIPSSIAFAVGILLFLLPFVDIKCNNMSLMKVSGVELATGFHIKTGNDNSLMDSFEKLDTGTTKTANKGEKKEPNLFALVALGLGALGLILSLLNAKAGGMGGLLTGILSAVAMIGLFITVKNDSSLKTAGEPPTEDATGMGQQMADSLKISVDFTVWFYLAVIAFALAAFFSYKRMKAK